MLETRPRHPTQTRGRATRRAAYGLTTPYRLNRHAPQIGQPTRTEVTPRAGFLKTRLQPGQVRLALICALFGGCALVLVWRLFTFQVLDTDHYQQLAVDERHAEIPIA